MGICAHCGGWGCLRCGYSDKVYIVTGGSDEIIVFSSEKKAKDWIGDATDLYSIREETIDPEPEPSE